MQGERSNEEKVALEQRLGLLTEDLDEKNNTHNLLTLQLKRLQVRTGLMVAISLHVKIWEEGSIFFHSLPAPFLCF